MTAVETHEDLIAPHGGYLVDRTGPRPDNVESLEQVSLTSRELSDLDMLASGALSPLEGFMGRDDYDRVLEEMRLAKGIPWALPVCLAVDHEPLGDEVTLTDEAGKPFAVLEMDEVDEHDKERASSATASCSKTTTRRDASSFRPSRPRCATQGRARRSGTRSAARTTAARTSSSGATTPASATTTAPTTRS